MNCSVGEEPMMVLITRTSLRRKCEAGNSSSVPALGTPTSPEAYRRETGWVYSQGAPPVMKGDLYYYNKDHDLTEEEARRIDTSKVAVYLLTGEYDPLNTPEGTARLARCIKGAHFQVLPGLGHFGPSENPEDFKPALLPILQEIAGLP